MSVLSLRIPDSIHTKVKEISKKEKISINQFIASALSEKLSAFMTEDYIQRRAKKASQKKFMDAMKQVPNVSPDENDKI